ncbi:hotdog fold thioesterase [Agriterribacter sp.]|uniref:hotdog fold thioesterase n=1 Tax=Agriterribacter sp. TaxID=2821509 RepID=UPI002BF3AB1C|nr:hotdog fold thioesterase [Agriterribacter sp.]HTN07611.1 hotdog fold thioesterase [Agriterribacter sp.]
MSHIWFKKEFSLQKLQAMSAGTMGEHIGIEFTEIGDSYLKATMPVDRRTRQPYGLLHGGASVALAETLGSVASSLVLDTSVFICVGLEINANHIRSARQGLVTGIATPIHLGSSTHVWDIKIYDERERLVCISRLTVAVLKGKDIPVT